MEMKNDPKKFINQVEELYQVALNEAASLLKNNPNGSYIAVPEWDDEVDTRDWNDVPIAIWAVGLNDDGHICVKACVMNVGYGYSGDEFSNDWEDITEHKIEASCYPELFRFVAENLDKATTKEEADKVKLNEDDED